MATEIHKVWNESHTRFRLISVTDNSHTEITPICIHRDKQPVKGSKDTFKCDIRPEVVHCCGQCISCKSYFHPDNNGGQLEINW